MPIPFKWSLPIWFLKFNSTLNILFALRDKCREILMMSHSLLLYLLVEDNIYFAILTLSPSSLLFSSSLDIAIELNLAIDPPLGLNGGFEDEMYCCNDFILRTLVESMTNICKCEINDLLSTTNITKSILMTFQMSINWFYVRTGCRSYFDIIQYNCTLR